MNWKTQQHNTKFENAIAVEGETKIKHMQVEYDDNPRPTRPTLRSTNNSNIGLRLCLHLIGTGGTCTICLEDTEQESL